MILKTKKNLSNAKLDGIMIGVIMSLGLFIPFLFVEASNDFNENFDSYPTILQDYANVSSSSGWIVNPTSSGTWAWTDPTIFQSFPNSLWWSTSTSLTSGRSIEKTITGNNLTTGIFGFYTKFLHKASLSSALKVVGADSDNDYCFQIELGYAGTQDDKITIYYFFNGSYSTSSPYLIPTPFLYNAVEWNTTQHEIRYSIDGINWGNWQTMISLSCDGIKRISFTDEGVSTPYDDYDVQIDGLSSEISYNICGSGIDCIFCNSSSTCNSAGCYWIPIAYGYNCSPTTSPLALGTTTPFYATTFYTDYCNYSTPTALFLSLTNISSGLLDTLSGWISNFSNLFDLGQASQKGTEMGQAIPKMRGYFIIVNGLFGNIPLGEIFIFYLIVLIGVIIFRIIRHIKGLLPFQ